MAITYAARWRPDIYRSTTETIIEGEDRGADPPQLGHRVRMLQLVIFDDTKVGTAGNPYVPGAPATEQELEIVKEATKMLEVGAFVGLTNAQARALWDAARDQQVADWQADPDIMSYVKAAIGSATSPYVVIG